jgi:DNA repair exonuclease SbcCD ATPase subunit
MPTIADLRTGLERAKGKRDHLKGSVKTLRQKLRETQRSLHAHEAAREVIRKVGLETQKRLQFHISEITSLALEAVFDDPYALVAEFVERRNRTECDLSFERGGELVNPLTSSGGGAVDIAAFALRVASWSMQTPKSRPVLILDEPCRFLSAGLLPKASEMLKEISERLGLQIIMVTHSEELMDSADRVIRVRMQGKKTLCTVS